ncbi:nitrate/nitrite sensor protein NarQ [compost metagenome]
MQDDGVGAPALAFEAADAYGVMGMRERARHFGGRIDIASAPGEGTRMCLTIALPRGAT